MSYTLDYANTKEKFDEIVAQDGVNIFIDKKAQLSILGNKQPGLFCFYNLLLYRN